MKRRGFLGALVATVAAPFVPTATPEPHISFRFSAAEIEKIHSLWRYESAPPVPFDALRYAMRNVYNQCASGGHPPNMVWPMK